MFNVKNIHFVGIGGMGMSPVAEILKKMNYEISGSDIKNSYVLDELKKLGIKVFIGHKKENIDSKIDVIVISSAIKLDNPEVLEAKKLNIPVIYRSEMLFEIMRKKDSILVAGAHGKTTTTSIIGWLFYFLEEEPIIITGGKMNNFNSNSYFGKGNFLVAEADESDGSFLKYNPVISVITNIDNDHLDFYKNMDNLKNAFLEFMNKIPFYGKNIICGDDHILYELSKKSHKKFITFGIEEQNFYRAKNIRIIDGGLLFSVYKKNTILGDIFLNLTGKYNLLNALGAITLFLEIGYDFDKIKKGIREFLGVFRRFEKKGSDGKIVFFDDYGHHPTEIMSVWKNLRDNFIDYKKIVIFQPHRYSRTLNLAKDFASVLKCMEKVLLLPIYSAGEENKNNITLNTILDYLNENDKKHIFCYNSMGEVINFLKTLNKEKKTVVLTLGAGDVYKIFDIYSKN